MGASEKQPNGIQFTNMNGKVTIHDLDPNRADDDNDNNSNASNESFDHDEQYQKEFDNKTDGEKDLATNETQEDHFQTPIQQHHLLLTNSKARNVVKPKKKLLVDEIDEESNSGVGDKDECDDDDIDNSTSTSGVDACANVNTSNSGVGKGPTINKDEYKDKVDVP